MPITDITVGDETPAYNRVWYNLDGQGYAHSGVIQPVQVRINDPDDDIPPAGRLAEVTVPFTDAAGGRPARMQPLIVSIMLRPTGSHI